MMRPLLAIVARDLKLAVRAGGGFGLSLVFFAAVVTITPFAIGPDLVLLSRIGPAILWIGALLATLLGLDRLFQADYEDGALDAFLAAPVPLSLIVLAKSLAHWLATGLPLALASPVLGLMLNLPPPSLLSVAVTLLVGTPALTLLGAMGAALTVSLKRGGLLVPVLVLPIAVPVLIFGVAATGDALEASGLMTTGLMLLSGVSLVFLVVAPLAAALALKGSDS